MQAIAGFEILKCQTEIALGEQEFPIRTSCFDDNDLNLSFTFPLQDEVNIRSRDIRVV